MKRLLLTLCLSLGMIWSSFAMAEKIGVVNLPKIFQSTQAQKINAQLQKEFSPQQQKIVTMGKKLQADVKKLQRNQAVMDKNSLEKLRTSIMQQEKQLRAAQAKFQQAFFVARSKAMNGFLTKISGVVKKIAAKKDLDMVLPKNGVLYAKESVDITTDVTSALHK